MDVSQATHQLARGFQPRLCRQVVWTSRRASPTAEYQTMACRAAEEPGWCGIALPWLQSRYDPTGVEWPISEAARTLVFGPFFTANRSFGMSLFCLIAAYMMVRSYNAHGPHHFVISRLTRLAFQH